MSDLDLCALHAGQLCRTRQWHVFVFPEESCKQGWIESAISHFGTIGVQ